MVKKNMKTQFLTFSFFLCFAFQIYAQSGSITPHSDSFDASLIKPESYKMDWYISVESRRIFLGEVATKIEMNENNITVITSIDMTNATMKWTDSTVAAINSLQPIYHSSYNQHREMVLNFEGRVTGYYLNKKTKTRTTIDEPIYQPFFDSNIYPQLIRWLPLKENYSATISIFNFSPPLKKGKMNATITNVLRETIRSKGEEIEVWKVVVTDDISDNQALTTYYIAIETRELLRQETTINGRVMLMESK